MYVPYYTCMHAFVVDYMLVPLLVAMIANEYVCYILYMRRLHDMLPELLVRHTRALCAYNTTN